MFKITQKVAVVIAAAVSLCAGNARAAQSTASYQIGSSGNKAANSGSATLGAGYTLDTSGRLLIYQGSLTLNEGAVMKMGGNASSSCNFIGIENGYSGATMTINGGTFWCCKDTGYGSGYLAVGSGIGKNNTSTLTLNSGILKVDTVLRSSAQWDDKAGVTASGTITINGGEATVGTIYMGATTVNTGVSTFNLNGGTLTAKSISFRKGNGQVFSWGNGTLVAGQANVFTVAEYDASNTKTRTMQITGNPARFDTAGYAQTIPAFTGNGWLRICGGGAVTFEQSTLNYKLVFDGATVNLGTLDTSAARLATTSLAIVGPTTLNVSLPASPSGRYPLIACTSSLDGSIGQLTVSGGGAGVLVRDGNTLYLSFDPADAAIGLVYSAAAGGTDTPAGTSYTRLAFTDTAGAFTVGGDALTNSQDIADMSIAPQTVTAPVTLSTARSSIYVADGGYLTLAGGLSATFVRKDGSGTLVLDNAAMPTGIIMRDGILDFGGNSYSGKLNVGNYDSNYGADGNMPYRWYHGEEILLTNGTCNVANHFEFQDATITIADGCTIDLTGANARVGVGYRGVDGDGSAMSKLIIDGGTVKAAGNKNGTCNFVGVDRWGTAILEVKRGMFYATGNGGSMRVGVNNRPYQTGIVRVRGGVFKLDHELTLATWFDASKAGTSKGIFELSGGLADIDEFYLGAISSDIGHGEVSLTGGVLEVGCLKCLAYCKQTLLADGATIRAKRADSAAAPFMAKVASADSYAKSYTIGAGGLTVDTAGHDVHCDIPWTGEGGLTIMGGGSLALGAPPAFTGDVVISNGTTLVMTNSATFAGTVSLLGADSKIRIDTTSYQEDSLTIATDGFTLPSGVTDVLDLVELVGDGYVASVSADGKSIELGLAANVAAFAWWTGGGDPAALDDPDNWACTNSTGGVVANALPVKSTVVVLSGTTSFAVPAGTTPVWATTQIGNGGGVALGTDCDWSAAPNLTIADGSYLDLCGHNLKISYLTAVEGYDGAYVTNSVAGTKPALWAENVFTEGEYIDTAKVTVFTDNLEVKGVNYGTFTAPTANLASAMDASCVVTGGTMTVGGMVYIGGNNHDGLLCVSNNAKATFYQFRVGTNNDTGYDRVVVADNATFTLTGFMTVGHHNPVESVFIQSGGTVSSGGDFNIGVGNTSTSRYEIASGSLTVAGSFVIGRLETTAGYGKFVQSGGTVTANKYISIGWNNGSVGLYYMSGGEFFISANRANLGSEAAVKMGIWDISGGTATTAKGLNVARQAGCTAKLRLSGSGKLVTADIIGDQGASTVEFDGGTLVATNVAASTVFLKDLTNIVFNAGGVMLDSAGNDLIATNCVMKATPGAKAITLTGGGAFDFKDTTLDFTDELTGGFVFAQATGDSTFTSVPALADGIKGYKVRLSADGKTIKVTSKGFTLIVR